MSAITWRNWHLCTWWMGFQKPFRYGLPFDFEPFNVKREPGMLRIGWFIFVLVRREEENSTDDRAKGGSDRAGNAGGERP